MELQASVTGVAVLAGGPDHGADVETGSIKMDDGAFNNFSGVQTASMNTGIGSANQAATAIGANANITFGDNGGTTP